jgi:UDP-galactopyranose mutase
MPISKLLLEELSNADKSEIRSIIQTELDKSLKDIEKKLSDKEMEKVINDVVADMFEKYHKILWQRSKYWSGAIKK